VLRAGRVRLALPAAVVRSITVASAGDARLSGAGGRLTLQVGDRLIACVSLAAAFGQPEVERPLVIEAQILSQSFAIAVESVEGEEEVLLRPLPAAAEGSRLIEGLALLSSGQPVAVLSPVALTQHDGAPRAFVGVPAAAAPARVRVLLVDDSRVTREMERRLLEDAGFVVSAASDGEEALRALGEHLFDCVVTDIEMPGMDGFRLTRELRALPQFAHLPIVVVSTRDSPEDRLRGMQAGADAYLTKQSLNAGELIEQVRRLAGR
jgi:two-component system chemotaxis sensor kinase CheA